MKKLFTLLAGVVFAASASAVTPYKNLYVEAEVAPTGVGEVYLDVKNDDERNYVKDQSDDYGDTAFLMANFGENGGADTNGPECYNGKAGIYEAVIYAEAAEGYEFVCLSSVLKEEANAVYTYADCFMPFSGEGNDESPRVYDWSLYELIADGVRININNEDHAEDGNSDTGRDVVFGYDNWSDTPDTKVYAIFRKVGAEYPKLVESTGEETPCETPVIAYTDAEGLSITSATPKAKCAYTISVEDNKSGNVNGHVDLTATYKITATATCVGYTDSEQATASLIFVTDGAKVETADEVAQVKTRGILVSSNNGFVTVSGLENGESVSFYSVDGKLIGKSTSANGTVNFASNADVVVAKVGQKSVKVAVK